MADKPTSWQKRRWALFLRAYEKPEFRNAYLSIVKQDKTVDTAKDLAMLFVIYEIPSNCEYAVFAYFNNPRLNEAEYLKLIKPPVNFWSLATETTGPNDKRSAIKRFRDRLIQAGKSDLISDDVLYEVLKVLVINHTVVEFSSFLTKQEISEVISQYWNELKVMIDDESMMQNWVYSEPLKFKRQMDKAPNRIQAEEAILQLHAQGKNDAAIATYLIENKLPQFTPEHIRVIRHRLKSDKATRHNG